MSTSISTTEALPTLSEDDCLHHRGPLAHPGTLSLTAETLTFHPTRTLDRLAGAEDILLPVDTITELTAGGINNNLDLYVGEDLHRFSGRGALRVHTRLLALLAEDDENAAINVQFEVGERVLLHGQAEYFVNDLMAVRGELCLTDRRLRFLPGLGLEQLIWNAAQIDVPLDRLQEWSLKGIRRRLNIRVDDENLVLGGALTPQLFNLLESLIGDAELSRTADEVVLDTWPVHLRRGPIAHPGELRFTPTHIHFFPTGVLDAMVGVKDFNFPIQDITRISIRGWPERKLVIRVGHEVHSFRLNDVTERFDGLRQLIRDRHYQIAFRAPGADTPPYQNTLDAWASSTDYRFGEQVVLGTFAMDARSDSEARFGWLLLLRTRILFLPVGGPASRESFYSAPLEAVCRLDGGPRSRQDQILMSTEQGTVRFLLSDREGVVDDFWSQCRSPTRILTWETLGPRSLSRIMGPCRFVRIMTHGDTVVDMAPGMSTEHESGVAIVLPGEPGTSVQLDTWVTIEIGQSEGIYQLDSKIVRSVVTPLEGVIPNPENTHLLIAKFPSEIRVYNQRESYRVATELELKAQRLAQTADGGSWMATGSSFRCRVVDISIGGCALDTAQEMGEGDRVSVNLPLLDQWVELRATCVRCDQIEDESMGFRYGLEFRELSMAQEDILHKAVMALQREALADTEEGEGEEADEVLE
jgi:hypothetical protein